MDWSIHKKKLLFYKYILQINLKLITYAKIKLVTFALLTRHSN